MKLTLFNKLSSFFVGSEMPCPKGETSLNGFSPGCKCEFLSIVFIYVALCEIILKRRYYKILILHLGILV